MDNTKTEIDIIPGCSVSHLKIHIENFLSIPKEQQRLIYKGYPMTDEQLLDKIVEGDILYIVRQQS
jgi:hypothetical protein